MNLEMIERLEEKYKGTGISLAEAYTLETKKESSTGIENSK